MPTLTPTSEDTFIYEFCMLYPVDLSQKEEMLLLKEIEGFFREAEGKVVHKDAWGRRGLAYPIRKNTEGNFVVFYVELDPSKVIEIDRQLRILPNLLRHLIVKPPKGYEVVNYSERFTTWLKERETGVETQRKEEEQRLQKKVAEKAKIQAKRAEAQKKDVPHEAVKKAQLTEKLEELISDNPLDL